MTDPRLVCSLPVDAQWLTAEHLPTLIAAIKHCSQLVALSIVGQFDRTEDDQVAAGLCVLARHFGDKVRLHRTDMAAIQFLARGGRTAAVATTASLRRVLPAYQRGRTRIKRGGPKAHVFLPGIDEFREVQALQHLFGDNAPECQLPGCCNRVLTHFAPSDPCPN